ncbi:MAG: LytR C-terminal domain-containing protein [Bifidobacteriaceae bacterium]|jgi:hypothetical protein|nr:LytR C-terminal domain-containing protein [Bifidobacteriaceae bacterium]
MAPSTPESRRQRLRWRQVTIYGLLIGGLIVIAAWAIGMWTGRLEPLFNEDFKYQPSESAVAQLTPCPVGEAATYPAVTAVTVRVLNGSQRDGLAGETADALAAQGFPAPAADNTAPYDGVAKLVAGREGVNQAYTLARFFPEGTVITIDRREGQTVDAVLGPEFETLRAADEVGFDPSEAIKPMASCRQVDEILGGQSADAKAGARK